jgi:hypothetical protein
MSPKKQSPKKQGPKNELKAAVSALRAELKKAEKRIGKLTSHVGGLEAAKAELDKQVKKLTKRLDKATRPASKVEPTPDVEPAPDLEPLETPAPITPAVVAAPTAGPDATWTVAQLRAEVAQRSLAGLPSRATKAQLLAALAPGSAQD